MPDEKPQTVESTAPPKKPYHPPVITDYGTLASLTLGSGGPKDDGKTTKVKAG